ncbi:HAD family hydrolase [Candidatus Peribacteria bacterium]|nr:HAD family hydrolase [Candidatus Peribacteria bacterium]
MTLFFDFDGTILANRTRYHRVHLHCLGNAAPVLSEEKYWELKRSKTSESEILKRHYPEIDNARYQKERDLCIESPEFLAFDRLLPTAKETLITLAHAHILILVTLRKNAPAAREEIDEFGLREVFSDVRIAAAGADPVKAKAELMRPNAKAGDWIIGDTEADILAGQSLGLTTCGVLSGIRNETLLRALHPTHLLASIAELPSLLR